VEETCGGYSAVARYLTGRSGRPVSRQQVYSWYRSRHVNGFPEPFAYRRRPLKKGQQRLALFLFSEVGAWHDGYVPQPGRPRKGSDGGSA
jgi:hypothetical protein